jgi:TPR repeat protein
MVAIKIAMMVVRVMVHHVYHATAQGRAGFSPWMRPGTGALSPPKGHPRPADARTWYQKAAAAGNADAKNRLASLPRK